VVAFVDFGGHLWTVDLWGAVICFYLFLFTPLHFDGLLTTRVWWWWWWWWWWLRNVGYRGRGSRARVGVLCLIEGWCVVSYLS